MARSVAPAQSARRGLQIAIARALAPLYNCAVTVIFAFLKQLASTTRRNPMTKSAALSL